jgi:hypothetical protein
MIKEIRNKYIWRLRKNSALKINKTRIISLNNCNKGKDKFQKNRIPFTNVYKSKMVAFKNQITQIKMHILLMKRPILPIKTQIFPIKMSI